MIHQNKSQPEPATLNLERAKANGTYRTDDVILTLKTDFYDKCYICEYKNPTSINIEHFIPHRDNHQLKFQWENLFWSCSHCNNIKGTKENLLNCTLNEDDVENRIKISLPPPFITTKVMVEALDNNENTMNTVELLNQVYNGTTTLKTIESYYIREELTKNLLKFYELIIEYLTAVEGEFKIHLKYKVINELHQSSSFSGFKRWIIKGDDTLSAEFKNCY